jgi:eukaryotic-like serine/threonine-protein kinase
MADRNLLFGILALRMDFIGSEQLVAAVNTWGLAKTKTLSQILCQLGALSTTRAALLDGLVEEHLKAHHNEPEQSLKALASLLGEHCDLSAVVDPDVKARLAAVGLSSPGDLDATTSAPPCSLGGAGEPRYRILRLHARGGLGEVFVAEDQELHREVALKEIQARYAHDPHCRGRFLLEAEITGGLEHPGIVPVHGLGSHADGRPFYAMRFIKGDNLQDAVRRFHEADGPNRDPGERTLALHQLLRRFLDICNTIAYAHSRGVVHRDLKPGNIMLGNYGETLVVDWGLAKAMGRIEDGGAGDDNEEAALRPSSGGEAPPTQMGAAMGTPAYMSPEQARGEWDKVGPASDVYSLGATLYALLLGQAPVTGRDNADVLRKVQRGDLAALEQVKPGTPLPLLAVCRKAMALRPEDRYESGLALAEEVEHWLADEPVAAYPEPFAARVGRWGRRYRPWLTAAAALLATAVLALSVSVILISQQKARADAALTQARLNFEEAKEQRRQAEDNANAARLARQQAEDNLRKAKRAVDDLLTGVSEDENLLVREPRMEQLRRKLLRHALAAYRSFLNEQNGAPEMRLEVVRSYRRLANLLQQQGEHGEAEAAYRSARDLCLKLAEEFPKEPTFELELAGAASSLGILYRATGRLPEARLAYAEALDRRQRLVDRFPETWELAQELAATQYNLSLLLRDLNFPEEAETAAREALAGYERLANRSAEHPEVRHQFARNLLALAKLAEDANRVRDQEQLIRQALNAIHAAEGGSTRAPELRLDEAQCRHTLGIVLRKAGRSEEAQDHLQQAYELLKPLAGAFPTVPAYQRELALTCRSLGLLRLTQKRGGEGLQLLTEGANMHAKLVDRFPGVPAHRYDLLIDCMNLCSLLDQAGQPQPARQVYALGRQAGEHLVTQFPAMADYQSHLAALFQVQAGILLRQGDLAEAGRLLEQAVAHQQTALSHNRAQAEYRRLLQLHFATLAEIRHRRRDHALLADLAREWHRTFPESAQDGYSATCCMARCAALASSDQARPEAERKEAVRKYSEEAVGLLRKAIRAGFKDNDRLRRDSDLNVLRGREDFRQLQAELDAEPRTSKP